jgi:hypothetical protein
MRARYGPLEWPTSTYTGDELCCATEKTETLKPESPLRQAGHPCIARLLKASTAYRTTTWVGFAVLTAESAIAVSNVTNRPPR